MITKKVIWKERKKEKKKCEVMMMGMYGFSLVIVLLFFQGLPQACLSTNSSIACIERERRALLKLKDSFSDPAEKLLSWKGKFCCRWVGIRCDKLTGHVTKLDLRDDDAIESGDHWRSLEAKEVDTGLLELEELRYLDLGGNDFGGINIPAFFGSMRRLTFLGLSHANFAGLIPRELGNLTGLQVLQLDEDSEDLHADSLEWVSNLGSLYYLDMSGVNLTNVSNTTMKVLSTLHSLSHLSLSRCYLDIIHSENLNSSLFTSLEYLDLSSNRIQPQSLDVLRNMTSLQLLDLSENSLNSSITSFWGWLERLEHMKHLNLRTNSFFGPLPMSLGNLSYLSELDLSENQLSGVIPKTLGDLSSLTLLYLSVNNLSGDVPRSLGNLRNLEVLDVSYNSLDGIVSEVHLEKLSKLRTLAVRFNHNLTFRTRWDWIPSFCLHRIHIAGCEFGSRFPRWLRTQNEVAELDLSFANINESFPNWLQGMTSLSSLVLFANRISGNIPSNFGATMPALQSLSLGRNLINGSIPKSLCNTLYLLDLSRNMLSGVIPSDCWESRGLSFINLSENRLSGTIPTSIGHMQSLMSFNVNDNNLNGELPSSLVNCTSLAHLDVGDNQFSGVIPQWPAGIKILRLRNNMLSGNIPRDLCTLSNVDVLDLANNNFSGQVPRCFSNLTAMTKKAYADDFYLGFLFGIRDEFGVTVHEVIKGRELEYSKDTFQYLNYMDLSSNDLHGRIPEELCSLVSLNGLNLSHNRFSGNIPGQIGNLSSLESLDLSHNILSGTIPSSLASLTMLAFLNMSFNNLSGQVPSGNQLRTLDVDPSIYAGNPLLCGPTLPNKCNDDGEDKGGDHDDVSTEEHTEDDKSEKIWLYLSIALGYATGLWVAIGTLFLKPNWRIAYFRLAEDAKDWMVQMVTVKLAKLCNKSALRWVCC